MPISTGQSDRESRQVFVDRLQQLWRKTRAELMESYGMDRDQFTAVEIFALRALAIEIANGPDAQQPADVSAEKTAKLAKTRKSLTK